ELREVDGNQLVLPKDEALFGIRGWKDSSHHADGLEEGQIPHELDRSCLAEAAHEVDGTALDVANGDGDRRSLHCLRVHGRQIILKLLNRLACRLNLPDQGERGLAVGSHENALVEILVVPDLDLEDILWANDVVLLVWSRRRSLRRGGGRSGRLGLREHRGGGQ